MMKLFACRFLCVIMSAVFIIGLCATAQASDDFLIMPEEQYGTLISLLNDYLGQPKNSPLDINSIRDQLQEVRGRYNNGLGFYLYASIMADIENGNYASAELSYTTLSDEGNFGEFHELLESDEFVSIYGAIRSVEALGNYLKGRREESNKNYTEAARYYYQCLNFYDGYEHYSNMLSKPIQAPTQEPTQAPTQEPDVLYNITINESYSLAKGEVVFSNPSELGTPVGTNAGTRDVLLLEISGDYGYIEFYNDDLEKDCRGYVNVNKLKQSKEGTLFYPVCMSDINLRSAPTTDSPVLTRIALGEAVEFLNREGNGFAHVKYKDIEGFAHVHYLESSDDIIAQIGETVRVVNCEKNVSLREKPYYDAIPLELIPLNQELVYLGRVSPWFSLVRYNGKLGYVASEYLSKS